MKRVLAVTFDGILQPLGYSQVVRVAEGLANAGVPYALVTLERASDLARTAHVARLRARLDDVGIPWVAETFAEGGGAEAVATNVARATRACLAIARREQFCLVHARAIPGALVGRALRAALRTPYLFDVRGYWIDEQVQEGRRFRSPRALLMARGIETELFRSARSVVTLTALQAEDLRAGRLSNFPDKPVEVIPTCADYDEFHIPDERSARPEALHQFAKDERLIAMVGALNRSYFPRESLRLARMVLERSPRFRLVILSAQGTEYAELLSAEKVDPTRVLVTSVSHDAMPRWMRHFEWSPLLLRSPFAKRASVPTKLAEFFASGVRVVQHGCNEEISDWVRRAGSGLVIDGIDDAALSAAADFVCGSATERWMLDHARDATRAHFSLESGIERYRRVIQAST